MKNKTNVIIITIDECKSSAMSPYGNELVVTPTAQRAATEGATFENAFTCHAKCVPSRCCMMSGRYPHTEGHRTLPGFELRKGEQNLASILKQNGYVTGMFGKNHTVEEDYKPFCFDEYTTEFNRGERRPRKRPDMPYDNANHRAFIRGAWKDNFDEEPQDYYDIEDGVNFIKNHKDESFFLLMNLSFPHPVYYEMSPYIDIIRQRGVKLPPIETLEDTNSTLRDYRRAYDLEDLSDDDWEKVVASYYSMVSYIDNCTGKIYDAVDDMNLGDKTVIVYTSDHGDFAGEHGCAEKYDTLLYDCLVKIPLFIKYPPKIPAGIRLDSMVENVDLTPTILDILDIPIPTTMHGKSMLPYITGQADKHKDMVFCEGGVEESAILNAPHYDSPECERMKPNYYWKQKALIDYPKTMQRVKMIRTKDWKLIYRQDGEKELYDLKNDPYEMQNIIDKQEHRDVVFDLMEKLIQWMMRTETDFPKINNLFA